MNREQIIEAVKRQLSDERFQHTLRVEETALQLAGRFGVDHDKVSLAALLHDYCKCWSRDALRQHIVELQLGEELLSHSAVLWHAFVGAEIVREQFKIEDEDVVNAIRYHTTGRAGMSPVEKVICLADTIEPGRDFPEVHKLRELAKHNLDEALLVSFGQLLIYLINTGRKLHPLTVAAHNELLDRVKQQIRGI